MLDARLVLDVDFVVADVDPRLFGSFVEHLGRCVYGGIYEPGHPTANDAGLRQDVMALVRELSMTIVRYPGGNFVSGYRWEDGVGPTTSRPVRLDAAWRSTESNQFGTNEFVDYCRELEAAPLMAVNLGTRGPEAAADLVEYCNHPGGTAWSDLRIAHGWREPHGIKTWCLGNEMDGPWQIGQKTATEYGRVASEAAKLMKLVDPSIELVACGSSGPSMPTFGAWEAEMLEHCIEHVDYVSAHIYLAKDGDDRAGFLASVDKMGTFIDELVATCDHVAARQKLNKRLMISFDEWNVWYHRRDHHDVRDWPEAPSLLEDVYTMEDALVVGGMLITLLNHCDRVRIACLAQLVNVIAPVMTRTGGPAWRQTIYHPIAAVFRNGRGTVLRGVQSGDEEAGLMTAAVLAPETGRLTVFALNRSLTEAVELKLDLRGTEPMRALSLERLCDSDLDAVNSEANPDRIMPESGALPEGDANIWRVQLPQASWQVIQFEPCLKHEGG